MGFAAYSGTGKTTLLKRLIPLLREQGLRLGLVKHAHHDFDLDIPGKDSYELRKAGAAQVLVASHRRWALVTERDVVEEPELQPMLERMDRERLDLILVEGFKHERFPKIELYRPSLGRPLIHPQDPSVIAVATDGVLPAPTELPLLDLNDPAAIADFVLAWMREADSQLQR
jgi:molybdopterin-guanine dinucleotide biosynthesis protein B